jgi:sulfur carrier protein ThiS
MPHVRFTQNVQRYVACPPRDVDGRTVREALEAVFADNAVARGYFLVDQGELRKHVAVFVDGTPVRDRANLSDAIEPGTEIDVMQALSGG